MQEQVIRIGVDGKLEGLMRKPGQGIDLRDFGAASVERVSLIEFDEATQMFYVQFIAGMLAGRKLTCTLYAYCTGETVAADFPDLIMRFAEYDEAVRHEVKVLDACMKRHLKTIPFPEYIV